MSIVWSVSRTWFKCSSFSVIPMIALALVSLFFQSINSVLLVGAGVVRCCSRSLSASSNIIFCFHTWKLSSLSFSTFIPLTSPSFGSKTVIVYNNLNATGVQANGSNWQKSSRLQQWNRPATLNRAACYRQQLSTQRPREQFDKIDVDLHPQDMPNKRKNNRNHFKHHCDSHDRGRNVGSNRRIGPRVTDVSTVWESGKQLITNDHGSGTQTWAHPVGVVLHLRYHSRSFIIKTHQLQPI